MLDGNKEPVLWCTLLGAPEILRVLSELTLESPEVLMLSERDRWAVSIPPGIRDLWMMGHVDAGVESCV